MINTKRPTVANFFAQVLRDEINHVQVRNVSFIRVPELFYYEKLGSKNTVLKDE